MRDVEADGRELERLCGEWPEWVGGTMRESDLALFCRRTMPWYIAEVQRLRKAISLAYDGQPDPLWEEAERLSPYEEVAE